MAAESGTDQVSDMRVTRPLRFVISQNGVSGELLQLHLLLSLRVIVQGQ